MGYTVEFVEDAKYVQVVLLGEVTKEDHFNSTDDAVHAVSGNSCNRLLVDTTQAELKMSATEDYDFVSQLPSQYPIGMRIAVVVHPDDFNYHKFIENVARNRGLQLTVFRDKVMASNWLLDEK